MTSAATTRRKRPTDRRGGFTLIELLVILAIMGVMVAVGVVSITAGQGAVRVKGAARDIFGAIRHARSVALVTGQPAVVTFSNANQDGEVVAKVEITAAKLLDTSVDRSNAETLSGFAPKRELVHIEGSEASSMTKEGEVRKDAKAAEIKDSGGESIEDILFEPIKAEIVKGMRLKVVLGDEDLVTSERPVKTKVSVFSNVDYLSKRYRESKEASRQKEESEKGTKLVNIQDSKAEPFAKVGSSAGDDEMQGEVSVVWETNGRVEPHRVWIYPDGKKPEEGLLIRVDRFGATKVLPGDGREEEK